MYVFGLCQFLQFMDKRVRIENPCSAFVVLGAIRNANLIALSLMYKSSYSYICPGMIDLNVLIKFIY